MEMVGALIGVVIAMVVGVALLPVIVNTINTLISRCRIQGFGVGVRFATGTNSSFGNAIQYSRVESNLINIDCQAITNQLTIWQTTFGGSGAGTGTNTGLKFIGSTALTVIGGDCELCATGAIEIDGDGTFIRACANIIGVYFEKNTCTNGDIRIGATQSVRGVNILGCYLSGDTGNIRPLNAINGVGLTIIGNAIAGGYTNNNPLITAATMTNTFVAANDLSGFGGITGGPRGADLEQMLRGTVTWDPAPVGNAAETTTTVTVTGSAIGDPTIPAFSNDLQGMVLSGSVSSTDTVTVVLRNNTGGALDLASGTLRATVLKH